MTHDEYLEMINKHWDEVMTNHPFFGMLTERELQIAKIAFLNGCHFVREM